MTTLRFAGASAETARLERLFAENADDFSHAAAVIAEGAAQLWLAEPDGIVGALVGRSIRSSDGQPRGGIENLLVDAGHRRHGIARELMAAAETHYRALRLRGMQLTVSAENLPARSLYDTLGYTVVLEYTRPRRGDGGMDLLQHRLRMWKNFEDAQSTARD